MIQVANGCYQVYFGPGNSHRALKSRTIKHILNRADRYITNIEQNVFCQRKSIPLYPIMVIKQCISELSVMGRDKKSCLLDCVIWEKLPFPKPVDFLQDVETQTHPLLGELEHLASLPESPATSQGLRQEDAAAWGTAGGVGRRQARAELPAPEAESQEESQMSDSEI